MTEHEASLTQGEEAVATPNEETNEFKERFMQRVLSDVSWAMDFYSERNQEFERQERWYFRDHYDRPRALTTDSSQPGQSSFDSNLEEEHLTTLNFPFSSVQKAHSIITGETPIIEVTRNSVKGTKVANMLHAVHQINTRRWGNNPMHDAIFNQLLYGWGVVRTTWARRAPVDSDGAKGDRPLYEFPIEVKSVHPRDVYPVPGGVYERFKAIIHRSEQRVYEVEDEWGITLCQTMGDKPVDWDEKENGVWDIAKPLDPDRVVEVIDYWCWQDNKIFHSVIAHNQFVLTPTWTKFYDTLPYTIFFCAATTAMDGHKMGLPLNYALVDSVADLEWLTNREMRIIDLYGDPILATVRVGENPIDIDSNRRLDLIEGENAYYVTPNNVPQLAHLQNMFRNQINEEGFASVQGESGIDTIAQQQAAAIKIFKPVENAQSAWEDVNFKVIGLFQRYSWSKSLTFSGRSEGDTSLETISFTMKGSDTKGYRETRVKIRARFPLEELRNIAAAANAKNSGLIPDKVLRTRLLGALDADEWESMIMEQQVKEDPMPRQFVLQDLIATLQATSNVEAMVQKELEATGLPNEERGLPGMEGSPESPMSTPQTGMPMEQSVANTEAAAGMGLPDSPVPTNVPAETGGIQGILDAVRGGNV